MTNITPCLWFNGTAEQAANFYISIFPNSKILATSRRTEAAPGQAGTVLTIEFEIDGQRLQGLNGGPDFPFTAAISLSVSCEDQQQVDRYWSGLLADGGQESQCGWLKDKFGLSWQIVPKALPALLAGQDRTKADRVMAAMMKMRKLDIAGLERAARAG